MPGPRAALIMIHLTANDGDVDADEPGSEDLEPTALTRRHIFACRGAFFRAFSFLLPPIRQDGAGVPEGDGASGMVARYISWIDSY